MIRPSNQSGHDWAIPALVPKARGRDRRSCVTSDFGKVLVKSRCRTRPTVLLYCLLRTAIPARFSASATVGRYSTRSHVADLAHVDYVPPLAEQKAIAAVLGALDDKIELNRRMNATLEAMARALFQSWFVDFDPVRAKLDGRQPPGLDPATAALFPNEFEDSELGHIPKGWSVWPRSRPRPSHSTARTVCLRWITTLRPSNKPLISHGAALADHQRQPSSRPRHPKYSLRSRALLLG